MLNTSERFLQFCKVVFLTSLLFCFSFPVCAEDYSATYAHTQLGRLRAEFDSLKKDRDDNSNFGYNGGFFLGYDKFNLVFNARIQPGYLVGRNGLGNNGHTFFINRTMLIFSGFVYKPELKYLFVLRPLDEQELDEFDVSYSFMEQLELHLVKVSMPVSAEGGASSLSMMFVQGSLTANRFVRGATIGVVATGEVGPVSYWAGVYNGIENDFTSNLNNEFSFDFRIDYSVFGELSDGESDLAHSEKPALAVGAGGVFANLEDDVQARYLLSALDARFKYKGLSVYAGGYLRQIDPDQFSQAQVDAGAVFYAGYFVIPKRLEVAARVSALFDDLTNTTSPLLMMDLGEEDDERLDYNFAGDVSLDSNNEYEGTMGVNLYFHEFNTKLQLQYSQILDGDVAGTRRHHLGIVQAQLSF